MQGSGSSDRIRSVLPLFFVIFTLAIDPFSFNPFLPVRLVLLVTFTTYTIYIWRKHSGLSRHVVYPLGMASSFVMVLASLSLISTFLTDYSVKNSLIGTYGRYGGLIETLSLGLLFLLACHVVDKTSLRKLIAYLAAASMPISGYAILQHFGIDFMNWQTFGWESQLQVLRSTSTFGNASDLGVFYVLILPVFFAALLDTSKFNDKASLLAESSFWVKTLITAAMIVGLLGAVFTYSRGAWLGILAAGVLFGLYFLKQKLAGIPNARSAIFQKALIAIMIFTIAVIALVSLSPNMRERLDLVENVKSGSAGARLEIWRATLPLIADHSLFGTGNDNFSLAFPQYIPLGWEKDVRRTTVTDKAHNHMLQKMADNGIFYALIYTTLILYICVLTLKKMRGRLDLLYLGLVCSITGYFVSVSFHFESLSTAPIFWLLMGAMVNYINDDRIFKLAAKRVDKPSLASTVKVFQLILLLAFIAFLLYTISKTFADHNFLRAMQTDPLTPGSAPLKELALSEIYDPLEDQYLLIGGRYLRVKAVYLEEPEYLGIAENKVKRAIQLDPVNGQNYFALGTIHMDKAGFSGNIADRDRELSLAANSFEKVIELDPNYSEAHRLLGSVLFLQNNHSKAIEELRLATTIAPGTKETYILLGRAYLKSGIPRQAKVNFLKALKIDPTDALAKQGLKDVTTFSGEGQPDQ